MRRLLAVTAALAMLSGTVVPVAKAPVTPDAYPPIICQIIPIVCPR